MSRLWHTNTHGIIVMYFVWAESAIVHGDFQQAQISFRLFWKRMLSSGTTICPNMQKEKKAPLVQICPKRKLLLLNARREEADFVSNYGYLQKMLKHEQSWICKKKQKTACVRTFRPRKMFFSEICLRSLQSSLRWRWKKWHTALAEGTEAKKTLCTGAHTTLVSYPTRWSLYSSLDFCVDHISNIQWTKKYSAVMY